MSNLIEHAKKELDAIGMTDDSEDMNVAMREDILELVEVFSNQGHSGFSAGYCVNLLEKLLRFRPIAPLTGEDSEWNLLDYDTEPIYQNKRCSRVFKDADGRPYDIEGKVFTDSDGVSYTNGNSRVYIEFPYNPTTEFLDAPEESEQLELDLTND